MSLERSDDWPDLRYEDDEAPDLMMLLGSAELAAWAADHPRRLLRGGELVLARRRFQLDAGTGPGNTMPRPGHSTESLDFITADVASWGGLPAGVTVRRLVDLVDGTLTAELSFEGPARDALGGLEDARLTAPVGAFVFAVKEHDWEDPSRRYEGVRRLLAAGIPV